MNKNKFEKTKKNICGIACNNNIIIQVSTAAAAGGGLDSA